jgi:hypothetical protein
VTGALPGIAKSSSKPRRGGKAGKAGGFALLTAAAGLAFKNRDKVTSMIRRDQTSDGGYGETVPATPSSTLDTAPEGVTPATPGMRTGDGAATAEDDAPKR